ncbi:minichromosome maintenance protein 5 [Saitozyma podzolica]|uniref:Minichromosome maintenance protein 5 n=1 Tax=Saitozyma podzolica TaxID=1890683 RepID=A0A427YS26_9TREE|nr:minichromosome maintenance protein 5 [Saitozyma podzolica]
MSGFEQNRVYTVHALDGETRPDQPSEIERAFYEFLSGFRVGGEFVYRDRLRSSLLLHHHTLDVDLRDLVVWNEELAQKVQATPGDMIPLLESALLRLARALLHPTLAETGASTSAAAESVPDMQVTIRSGMNLLQFRDLTANTLTTLVRLPGIVINASQLSSRATQLHLQCKGCRTVKTVKVPSTLGGEKAALPRRCDAPAPEGQPKDCPLDPYVILHDRCKFVDQQTIKLQEAPDMVPVGELPRHMMLHAERYLTAKVVPGSRIIATGIYSTFAPSKSKNTSGAPALRQPYLRVLGIELDTSLASSPGSRSFSPEEEEEFQQMARSDGLFERFASSVAPSIFGNLDIKKAVTCLLMGGSKKILPDGMRLRGDINVLLLGDPGTAKSQLLKFVEKVSPVSVYTSGKGSSAAGLTASVQRDAVSREFYLEGGAMVLADGGVVCIDEFDKMRDEDRVAIHEAMEQQTISIAKAGITTQLNSRTSVLAAANPVFGRYDDMKSAGENIDMQTTIMSRFDLIFLVRDEHNEARDRSIAKHVMNLHQNLANDTDAVGEIDIDKMRRYVSFVKSRCAPRLSPEASELLSSHFVSMRKQVHQIEQDAGERSSIPMTVRQLEALIRISESLAKITMSPTVRVDHVTEATRLFQVSTLDSIKAGEVDGLGRAELKDEMEKITAEIARRLPISWSTSVASLHREFASQGYSAAALDRTLLVLERREVLRLTNARKTLQLMQTVFRAVEEGKIAIVESPTGTGKSLTLLTATLTWLAANQKRLDIAAEANLRARLSADDPDGHLEELRAAQEARKDRLAAAREKERKLRAVNGYGAFKGPGTVKRARASKAVTGDAAEKGDQADQGDDQFLPEDKEDNGQDEGMYLSAEVRELMAKYDAGRPKAHVEDEKEEDVPKIYYTSRTHTQLRQLTSELLKTSFARSSDTPDLIVEHAELGVSLVPLGSRKQLCINDKVRSLAKNGSDERINEACLDMQKAGKTRCEFLPSKADETAMLDARDAVLASVKDIEDIVAMGKASCVCPYYSTRRAVKQAQLVTLPYNLLLQKNAREALDINLRDQIVVIDEAHNLIDTLLGIHSTTLTSYQLSNAASQLQQYLQRFRSRLKPVHALWVRQTLGVLQGLVKVCERYVSGQTPTGKDKSKAKVEMLDTNQLMGRLGGGSDQVNLMEMVAYLKESKLARKVSGFTEKSAEEAAKGGKAPSMTLRHAAIAAFHQVEAFLLSLTDARDDGRVVLSVEESAGVTMRYILLNPAERFREVVEQARSVVLAGGTMEPVSDFFHQLFPAIPRDRISTLSCAHVIPKSNLLTQVISQGPRKQPFEFKYSNRDDENLAIDRARGGDTVRDWPGTPWRGCVPPVLFYEPQSSGDVETVLRDYALAISSAQAIAPAAGEKRKTGALLFAVVGGKLSEGINFSDNLGRCVIMVGLPFANVGSVELQERMKYVSSLPNAGPDAAKELYENLCMRAVNQSIGRAIRHANDFAAILLVDRRYATPRIRSKLPKWIGEDVQVPQDYAGVARGLAAFFREKRERDVL